jgi:hypothetical protein
MSFSDAVSVYIAKFFPNIYEEVKWLLYTP